MNSTHHSVIVLAEEVTRSLGAGAALNCYRDCLLQWGAGGDKLLGQTVAAWWNYLTQFEQGNEAPMEVRHERRVPAIPQPIG
jgi:hypothetical protein